MSFWKIWRGQELIARIHGADREAVRETCEVILEAAKQEVPLAEGTLMESGMVIMEPGGEATGNVSFGGGPGTGHPIVPYARRWHENSANFQRGRKRFYVKDPLNRLGPETLRKALAGKVRSELT